MISRMSSFIIPLFLIFLLTFYPCVNLAARPDLSATKVDLVAKACTLAPNKDLCRKTINSVHQSPKKDVNDLAFICFDHASNISAVNIEFVTETLEDVEGSDEPGDAAVMQSFQDCEQQYEGVVDEIDNAVSALASRSKEDDEQIETWLKDAIVAVQTCEKTVKGKGEKGQQLSTMNQQLLELLNNVMAVFQIVKQ